MTALLARTMSWLGRRPRVTVAAAMAAATVVAWAPFAGRPEFLYRYWDGPHYAYLAKTLYDVPADHPFTAHDLMPAYYATHLPAYPLLIRALVPLTFGHYLPAMLLATLLCSVAAALLFYELLARWKLVQSPLWTAVLFSVLPPRWVIYHSVGATEPLFLCFVFGCLLAVRTEREKTALLMAVLASLTRIMGILLVPVLLVYHLHRRRLGAALRAPIAGVGLLALFAWHHALYGDALAYFTRNVGQAGHVAMAPFAGLRGYAGSASTHSAELFLSMYLVYGVGTLALWRERLLFLYCAAFLAFNAFVFHFDLSRMFLPMAPFALLVGYDAVLSKTPVRVAAAVGACLGYTYVWGQIPQNLAPQAVFDQLLLALR
jgi:hypothetical protein